MERRKESRFGLRVPVLFSSEDTQLKQTRGFTRDISAWGAYILCEKSVCPGQGDTVVIDLMLPSIADVEGQGIKLKSKGQVLRTRDSQEESGFAMLADCAMELTTGSKNSEQSGELP